MDFSFRSDALEHLDQHGLDLASYIRVYDDINRCNNLLGGTRITLNAIDKLINGSNKKSYTIYDMGCGDGEMLRQVANHLKSKSISCDLVGIDVEDTVLEVAQEASKEFENITYRKQDILSINIADECDIVLCTLTMHHFQDEKIESFLQKFVQIASVGIVINDLQRSWLAYQLFRVFSLVFIRSSIAKDDGLTSISKGFRLHELQQYAKKFKEHGHYIKWKWAFRYVWILTPKSSS